MFQLLFLLMSLQGPAAPVPCQARLELNQQDGMLTVTGHCRNLLPSPGRYSYELSTVRESAGGRSRNMQRGQFEVAPRQEVALSQTRVNASPQDSYHIVLRVLDASGHQVAQDSASQISAR